MLIFTLDSEPQTLDAIRTACPDAETLSFPDAESALTAIRRQDFRPDAVFSDVVMSGMSGLEFAAELRKLCPHAGLVFVTAFRQYALEAYRVHADGYVLKPLTAERVREELDHLSNLKLENSSWGGVDKLLVQCFGHFEVFWHGEPLKFHRRQTKELFALLIDRDGASCTAEEISAALWEDESDLMMTKARIRRLAHDMRDTLRAIGQEAALTRHSGEMSIRRDRVECDYYRYIDSGGNAGTFYGEYMSQYTWAREKEGWLYFRYRKGGGDSS